MWIIFVSAALASGWTQPAREHYVKLGGRALPGSDFFPDAGDTQNVPSQRYLDVAIELYGEVGLTEDWTLVGQALPIGYASLGDQETAYAGVVQLGVRRRLIRGQHNLSLQLDVGYTPPLGETDLFTEAPVGDDGRTYRYLPTQSGAQGDLLLGYGVGFGRAWVAAQAGAAGFTNADIGPAGIGYAQIGVRTRRNNAFTATIPFRAHLASGPDTNLAGSGQTDYVGFRLEVDVTFGDSGWGISTGFVGAAHASANEASLTLPLYVTYASSRRR